MHPGLRTIGLHGLLLLSRQLDVIDGAVVKSKVQEYWSQNLVKEFPSFGGWGTMARGLQCVCIIGGGLSRHFSELLPLDILALDWKALLHSHWINFHHQLLLQYAISTLPEPAQPTLLFHCY